MEALEPTAPFLSWVSPLARAGAARVLFNRGYAQVCVDFVIWLTYKTSRASSKKPQVSVPRTDANLRQRWASLRLRSNLPASFSPQP